AYIHEHYSMNVTLTDVHNALQANLSFVQCTATRLPFDNDAFDAALLSFVLHHADDPQQVMQEALRVSRHVLVLESVAYHPLQRRLLGWTDAAVNAVRSGGTMAPPHPETYRSLDGWMSWMQAQGGQVVRKELIPGRLHPWAVLVVRPAQRASASTDTSLG
ncbi:MAG: methyltransferase domain-containing protein, partial [Longimonas sp.]|uniref:class I SAM-dependent methyltransferase n=1 Tax=Longimonas sp. TaxID=2039626 RepID=UPI0033607B2B